MYVHAGKGIAYLAHPRTASRATAEVLIELGFSEVGRHHYGPGVEFGRDFSHRRTLEECRSFCVVRNHFDAVVSWAHRIGAVETEPVTWRGVEAVLESAGHYFGDREMFPFAPEVDDVLRFEDVPYCIETYLADRGFDVPVIDRQNESERPRELGSELTRGAVRLVEHEFGDEIDSLGYEVPQN